MLFPNPDRRLTPFRPSPFAALCAPSSALHPKGEREGRPGSWCTFFHVLNVNASFGNIQIS